MYIYVWLMSVESRSRQGFRMCTVSGWKALEMGPPRQRK